MVPPIYEANSMPHYTRFPVNCQEENEIFPKLSGGAGAGVPGTNPFRYRKLPGRQCSFRYRRRGTGVFPEAVPPPAPMQDCKGRSPLQKKTKNLPLPLRGRGSGGWGQRFIHGQGKTGNAGTPLRRKPGRQDNTAPPGNIPHHPPTPKKQQMFLLCQMY